MIRFPASPSILFAAVLMLGACNGSKPAGTGNTTMRDMEVVDGTANDSMADLDNATGDGTLLSNAGGLPGAVPMTGSSDAAANASTGAVSAANSSEGAPKEKSGNASAPE